MAHNTEGLSFLMELDPTLISGLLDDWGSRYGLSYALEYEDTLSTLLWKDVAGNSQFHHSATSISLAPFVSPSTTESSSACAVRITIGTLDPFSRRYLQ